MSQKRPLAELDPLERSRFFPRQIVSPADLSRDQKYLLQKTRRHNRLLHTWGIRLGFVAKPILKSEAEDWIEFGVLAKGIRAEDYVNYWLMVTPGYALTPLGDELFLPQRLFLDTHQELDGALVVQPGSSSASINPRTTPTGENTLFLVVEAWESEVHPVRAASNRYGDHPDQFEYSAIRDILRFRLVDKTEPAPYGKPSDDEAEEKRLTGKDVRNYLFLGSIVFQDNKIDQVLSGGRDPQLTPT